MADDPADRPGPRDDFSFAFQPIVDISSGQAYSHEALVRGKKGESAAHVLHGYRDDALARFDAACRAKAIETAVAIGMRSHLNINCLPSAMEQVETGLESTVAAANHHGMPLNRIIVEVTENQAIGDHARFARLINAYRRQGIQLAIDDFGAGHSGLNLLAEFQPDMVKLDMALVRGIHAHGPRQAIVRAINQVCEDLGISFVVEGVENLQEFEWFQELGVQLYQGYLFARPAFEAMPPIRQLSGQSTGPNS